MQSQLNKFPRALFLKYCVGRECRDEDSGAGEDEQSGGSGRASALDSELLANVTGLCIVSFISSRLDNESKDQVYFKRLALAAQSLILVGAFYLQ